jgi:hypothetical protein
MTFSFRPRVISWNDAVEMNESVDSDALVTTQQDVFVRRSDLALGDHAIVFVQQPQLINRRHPNALTNVVLANAGTPFACRPKTSSLS